MSNIRDTKTAVVLVALLAAAFAAPSSGAPVITNHYDGPYCETNNTWLEDIHDYVFGTLQGHVTYADSLCIDRERERLTISNSTFELEFNLELKDDQGLRLSFYPRLRADLNIPNLQRRWKIFLHTISPDDLPEADRLVDNDSLIAGIRHIFYQTAKSKLDLDVGIKWRNPPVSFLELEYARVWNTEKWKLFPRHKLFLKSDDGFGATSIFTADRWIGSRTLFRSDSAATFSEASRGIDWEQSLSLGYVMQTDEKRLIYTYAFRASMLGHYDQPDLMIDRYRFSLLWRRRFLRNWIFIKFIPGVEVLLDKDVLDEDEEDRIIPSFLVGFDMFFGAGK